MRAFSLATGGGIPLKVQLKAHIKYQILAGILRPTDQLPPLRDLAAGLGINLNTVVRAVDELEAEGYVYSHQGRGVFVTDEFPGQGHGAALRSLMAGVLQSAQEWGIPPEEMALAMLAHGNLARPPQAAAQQVLLVGGSRAQLRRLQSELETALPVVVVPILAEDASDKVRTGLYRMVASTLFHAPFVKTLLDKTPMVTLASPSTQETFSALRQLPPGSIVAVASRDWVQAARIRHSLEHCSPSSIRLEIAVGHTPGALAPVLRQAQAVLASPECREIAREAVSGQRDVILLTEPIEIPPEALTYMRRSLGTPTRPQRVQIRSAWV